MHLMFGNMLIVICLVSPLEGRTHPFTALPLLPSRQAGPEAGEEAMPPLLTVVSQHGRLAARVSDRFLHTFKYAYL